MNLGVDNQTQSRWLAIALLIVVFMAGILSGAAVRHVFWGPRGHGGKFIGAMRGDGPMHHGPGHMGGHMGRGDYTFMGPEPGRAMYFAGPGRFLSRLDLNDEQEEQIEEILEKRREEARKVMESTRDQVRAMMETTHEQIKAILTPEQQEQFDEFLEGRQDFFMQHRGPGWGQRGGMMKMRGMRRGGSGGPGPPEPGDQSP